jgi:hypothetical protein
MRVEIPGNGGISDLIMLLLGLVLVLDKDRMLEYALLGEELPDEAVPVLQVIPALRSLEWSQ